MWLLLHGFTGSPASWERVLDAHALDGPFVAPFLLGHGPDWRSFERSTFVDEVDRIAHLANHSNSPRFVAGYSLGARVAFVLLARHPALFSGAVLIGARPGIVDPSERERRRISDSARAATLRRGGLHSFLDSWETDPLFDTQRSLPAEAHIRQRQIREGHDSEGLARSLEVLGLASMPTGVSLGHDAKITLMTGERDEKFRRVAARLAEASSHLRAVRVPDAGHNLLLEAPGEVAREMSCMAAGARRGELT